MPTPSSAQILTLDGPDAAAFAQTQFSSNVASLSSGQWQFSAWLDARGRVRALFHLAKHADDRLWLLMRGGDATSMANELRRFIFRSRVMVKAQTGVLRTGAPMPTFLVDTKSQYIQLGCGTHSIDVDMQDFGQRIDDDAWRALQLREGWPWLPETSLNELLPPALAMHHLGAVALDKGCYPGQEIVARMHYRHGHKRHLHRIVLSQDVAAGTILKRRDHEFVRVLDATSQENRIEALAIIADEIAEVISQGAENISDNGITVALLQTWPD